MVWFSWLCFQQVCIENAEIRGKLYILSIVEGNIADSSRPAAQQEVQRLARSAVGLRAVGPQVQRLLFVLRLLCSSRTLSPLLRRGDEHALEVAALVARVPTPGELVDN